jgi:hypothetical protein
VIEENFKRFLANKKCYLSVTNFFLFGVQVAVQRKRYNID